MVLSKKGFELQFHWIFIMIAGALILAFFFSVAQKQRSLSQEKLSLTLASDVENIFTGAIVSRGTAQVLPVPPQGIAFECSEGCACRFSIGRASRDFGDKVMFAPALLSGQDVVVWAVEWKQPYRVTNFLFLTNPDIKYYFVYNDADQQSKNVLEQLTKNLPPLVNYEKITDENLPSVENEDYDSVVFVLLNVKPVTLDSSFRKADVRAVEVINVPPQAHLNFYRNNGAELVYEKAWPIIDLTAIYAAIFADSPKMYECGMKSAFKKMSYVSELYAERAEVLEADAIAAEKTWCVYENSVSSLREQKNLAKSLVSSLEQSKIAQLNPLMNELDKQNRVLVQQSCPEMF